MQTISSDGDATDPVKIIRGMFSLDISGTFSGTVTIQRAPGTIEKDAIVSGDWVDLPDGVFVEGTSKTGIEGYQHWYRATFKTGEYTSGSANILMVQV